MMKGKESPSRKRTIVNFYKKSTNEQKWYCGNFKLTLMILCFANMCNMSFGHTSSNPHFAIENQHCRRYIHPWATSNTPQGNPIHLYSGVYSWIHFQFIPVDGKWGYIRHIQSGYYWNPNGNDESSRKKGTKIHLCRSHSRHSQFSIDQITGLIQHRNGLYVHFEGTSCRNGARIHLWDSTHHRSTWRFVNPYKTSEDVLVYGPANVYGDWRLMFAVSNSPTEHIFREKYLVGKSKTRESSSKLTFQWQVSAKAKYYFAEMSTSITLTSEIQTTTSSTWYSEREASHEIPVKVGQSFAVWQRLVIGEQMGVKEVFQTNIIKYSASPYVKPPKGRKRTSMSSGNRFPSMVYNTDAADFNMYDLREHNLHQHQETTSISPTNEPKNTKLKRVFMPVGNSEEGVVGNNFDELQFNDISDDELIHNTNASKDIVYDENGVFALYPYVIVDDGDSEDDNGQLNNVENKAEEQEFEENIYSMLDNIDASLSVSQTKGKESSSPKRLANQDMHEHGDQVIQDDEQDEKSAIPKKDSNKAKY